MFAVLLNVNCALKVSVSKFPFKQTKNAERFECNESLSLAVSLFHCKGFAERQNTSMDIHCRDILLLKALSYSMESAATNKIYYGYL